MCICVLFIGVRKQLSWESLVVMARGHSLLVLLLLLGWGGFQLLLVGILEDGVFVFVTIDFTFFLLLLS